MLACFFIEFFLQRQAHTVESELRARLATDGVAVVENAPSCLWRYNPPWTIPWFRSNEIAVELPQAAQ